MNEVVEVEHDRGPIQRTLRILVIVTVVLAVVLTGLIAYVAITGASQRKEIQHVTITTTKALCTLRHDFEIRVAQSRQFLKDHPKGIPGIPPELIQQGIDQQQSTIDALSDLDCTPF